MRDDVASRFPRALIFDFDGTLAETEMRGHRVAYNAAFRTCGLGWEWDVPRYRELLFVGGGKERLRHYVERCGAPVPAGVCASALIERIHAAKVRHFDAIVAAGAVPLRPGVRRLVAAARAAGIRLAIATTAAESGVRAVLARAGGGELLEAFEVIAAGDVVAAKKPAPDVYRWTLARLGLPASVCLAFEDSEIGLRSSRAAGVPTVVTLNEETAGHDFSGALAVLTSLGEPDQPFTALAGDVDGHTFVDVPLLHRWGAQLARANASDRGFERKIRIASDVPPVR